MDRERVSIRSVYSVFSNKNYRRRRWASLGVDDLDFDEAKLRRTVNRDPTPPSIRHIGDSAWWLDLDEETVEFCLEQDGVLKAWMEC